MKKGPTLLRFWSRVEKLGDDDCWVWVGCTSRGYGYIRLHNINKSVLVHRFSYEQFVGRIRDGMEIDHVCSNRLCVNPSHLRECSRSQNAKNKGSYKTNKTGFKGVCKKKTRWCAQIQSDGVHYHLGLFKTPEEAHSAYVEQCEKLHGDFSNTGGKKC